MIYIRRLIWDEWNVAHIARHNVSPQEVEEVCHGKFEVRDSYRKRILIYGETKAGRNLAVVLSPEDINLKLYDYGSYYTITAFEEEVEYETKKN